MKNLFGYNVKNPELRLDGEEFIVRRIEGGDLPGALSVTERGKDVRREHLYQQRIRARDAEGTRRPVRSRYLFPKGDAGDRRGGKDSQ